MRIKTTFAFLAIGIMFFIIHSCTTHYFRSNYYDANSLIHETRNLQTKIYLKVHLKNGDVCILKNQWHVDTLTNILSGSGSRYNFNRAKIYTDSIFISLDSVAIFETNRKLQGSESGRIAALSILAGVDIAIGLYCMANPKACFGSCPTFYINENTNLHYADAEGFSNAITPSMEYSDIDALNFNGPPQNKFAITMKNEALETHCVNDVKLFAIPKIKGENVYQSPVNIFYLSNKTYNIKQGTGNEGDITSLLSKRDMLERFSPSDENDLNSREEIILEFDGIDPEAKLGLSLSFRQTLMTTYLFYSAMGYMGDEVSDIFALLETQPALKNKFDATTRLLGGIDVAVWDSKHNRWISQSGFNETGPIAINSQVIPLTNVAGANIKVKLRLNKGFWRIDHAALINIRKEVIPVEISPTSILNKGNPDGKALKEIIHPEKYLVSMPGSEYKFLFDLPEKSEYEFFLYSKGYYLEWMRSHWLKDKDLNKLQQMVFNPARFLKEEAKKYKQYENSMEEIFWNSKIDTQAFSYYEN